MMRVDAILFSNVATAVQRTAHLPGGDIRGLPNGMAVEGIKGVGSFAAEIADAHNEFKLGRVHNAAQRVRQIEMQFNGLVGRWNGSIGSILTSARQGKQALSLQKLNEVKNAQTKMQQLASPASKAFRDLISALDYAIGAESGSTSQEDRPAETTPSTDDEVPVARKAQRDESIHKPLDAYARDHELEQQLRLITDEQGTTRIKPKLEPGRLYYFLGWRPPMVLRLDSITRQEVILLDEQTSLKTTINAKQLKSLIGQQIWVVKG